MSRPLNTQRSTLNAFAKRVDCRLILALAAGFLAGPLLVYLALLGGTR